MQAQEPPVMRMPRSLEFGLEEERQRRPRLSSIPCPAPQTIDRIAPSTPEKALRVPPPSSAQKLIETVARKDQAQQSLPEFPFSNLHSTASISFGARNHHVSRLAQDSASRASSQNRITGTRVKARYVRHTSARQGTRATDPRPRHIDAPSRARFGAGESNRAPPKSPAVATASRLPSAGCRPRRSRSSGCRFIARSSAKPSDRKRANSSNNCPSDLPALSRSCPQRSNGSNSRVSPNSSIIRARGIQSVRSP